VIVNVEQAQSWNGNEGEAWAASQDRYDTAVRAYNTQLLDAASISTHDRVLDIGCGCGESTRGAARLAAAGSALGVDLSAQMLERARGRARETGIENVTFEQADAQVHPFETGAFDLAISRFGAMFFGDPVAAFRNIGNALRPGARLALISWQPLEKNEWLSELRASLAMGRTLPAPPVGTPGPFGLAEPRAVRGILADAGYVNVDMVELDEPFEVGADADDAFGFVETVPVVKGMLQDLDDTSREQALAQLRATLVAHETPRGVILGSSGWLITAERASGSR
jgi:SAM-dependent methyltransferase